MFSEEELTDDAITRTFRLFQRRRGHRYSVDDVTTAWEAASTRPNAARYLDMGCGIGSVLHIVAYKLSGASVTGIEAQEISFELLKRNVTRNGLSDRVRLIFGDLRVVPVEGVFDLITGTPPYVPVGNSIPSPDSQRAHARVELRGGVEDYMKRGAELLAENGRLVVCADARTPERVTGTASSFGLTILRRRDVIPRAAKKDPLFTVWTFGRADEGGAYEHTAPLVIRDEQGARTDAARELRAFVDMPQNDDELPSP